MPETVIPEAAVRLYLLWLEDPSNLVDEANVKKAEAAVERAKDPIERLHALADLEHARQADGDAVTKSFVAQAKAWADSEDIPVSAFREMGVPDDVLAEAGFAMQRPRRGRRVQSSGSSRSRAPRVPIEQITAAVNRLPKQFTLSDLGEKAGGGSPATLRKAVDDLISQKKVKKVGPMENYKGRGRAPTVYELT
jgi:hypothetical protein